jgi:hypothetical protein
VEQNVLICSLVPGSCHCWYIPIFFRMLTSIAKCRFMNRKRCRGRKGGESSGECPGSAAGPQPARTFCTSKVKSDIHLIEVLPGVLLRSPESTPIYEIECSSLEYG